MLRRAGIALFLLTLSPSVFAQPTALNEQQRMGQLLVSQSCGVCHFKPQIIASTFGPALSKEFGGRPRRRHARGDHERNAAYAGLQAQFRAGAS